MGLLSGMWIVIQPFKSAMLMACNCKMLFPDPRGPLRIRRRTVGSDPDSIWSNRLAIRFVSSRMSVAGRWNKCHSWVALKASFARNASIKSSGSASICPWCRDPEALTLSKTARSLTARALTLLNTTLFRAAFRSPGATTRETLTALLPLDCQLFLPALSFALCLGLVVKRATLATGTRVGRVSGLARHLAHMKPDMFR